jgi:hypothetical protein
MYWFRLGRTRVHLGAPAVVPPPEVCSRNRCFVDQNEKRDLISRALGAEIPNPGSVARRTKRDILDVSTRVGVVGGHFATVSFNNPEEVLEATEVRAPRRITKRVKHGAP